MVIRGSSSGTTVTETGTTTNAAPGPWQRAAVVAITPETARAKSYRLHLERPTRHLPGQHFIVRLTAPDGYTAARSYSVASAPNHGDEIELTVERLDDGEVSTFLHDEVMVGDELDVRGPIGGWFVWPGEAPAVLVGGGSGVVPLMSMLRWARQHGRAGDVRLVVSVRTPDDLYYRGEITGPETSVIYSRVAPAAYPRRAGRVTTADLRPALLPGATAYVCGSASFANAATDLLMDVGVPEQDIRVERFGPTG